MHVSYLSSIWHTVNYALLIIVRIINAPQLEDQA